MCRRVNCSTCGKPTFAGCGAHIEQVLGDVPAAQRCRCREEKSAGAPSAAPTSGEAPTWMTRLFGKG
jgi:hypothetical protein